MATMMMTSSIRRLLALTAGVALGLLAAPAVFVLVLALASNSGAGWLSRYKKWVAK